MVWIAAIWLSVQKPASASCCATATITAYSCTTPARNAVTRTWHSAQERGAAGSQKLVGQGWLCDCPGKHQGSHERRERHDRLLASTRGRVGRHALGDDVDELLH